MKVFANCMLKSFNFGPCVDCWNCVTKVWFTVCFDSFLDTEFICFFVTVWLEIIAWHWFSPHMANKIKQIHPHGRFVEILGPFAIKTWSDFLCSFSAWFDIRKQSERFENKSKTDRIVKYWICIGSIYDTTVSWSRETTNIGVKAMVTAWLNNSSFRILNMKISLRMKNGVTSLIA